MPLHWSLPLFEQLYASIQQQRCDVALFKSLKDDLINLTRSPAKSPNSRTELEKGKLKFSDGLEYELNDSFKFSAATLSDELNLDEVAAAEILSSAEGSGNALLDSAKAAHYLRKQHILSIVSYVFNCDDQQLIKELWSEKFVDDLMEAFKFVHEELKSIHQSVARTRFVGDYSAADFQLKLTFRRDFLNQQHEMLGEILYGLVSQNLINKTNFVRFLDFASSFDIDDIFITHLLPALFLFCSKLDKLREDDVKVLHSDLLKALKDSDIYQRPVKLIVILVFITYFINWCKASNDRINAFDFDIAIETPMTTAVQLGAIEQLLIICAETSDNDFELFYDLRSLLEQHLPRLVPKRILDINEDETKKVRSQDPQAAPVYIVTKAYKLSENLSTLLTETIHNFVQCFIFDAAFLLIKIKDSEEDSLLSGEDSLLDDISKKADLERFYLAVYYLYANREDLISTFWEDRESNAYGFIEWASKGDDLLMRSTFLVMLSALTKGEENANHVYHFIANSDKVSWSVIINILNAHIEAIFKFEASGDDKDLNEETILSISSYFTLIYKVAENNTAAKDLFDLSLFDTLFLFIKLDTPLIGAVLHVLGALVSENTDRRTIIWERLDQWLFAQDGSIDECFQSRLVAFPDILGFVHLIEVLLRPRSTFGKFTLPYPQNLGHPYRKPGLTPYLDFLLSNVFFYSPSLYFAEKVALQDPILRIIDHCLSSFDPKIILNSFPAGVDLNKVVSTGEFTTYTQASPAPIVMNYLFQEKIYTTLLDITSTGFDNICDKSFDEKQVQVVDLSLQIIEKVLSLEVTYIDELLPILKKDNRFFMPSRVGTHGLSSFYDAILFNLPVVAHIALYIGSSHLPIADKSIKLMTRFSKSSQFGSNNPNGAGKTKLLTIMDSVNESLRIKVNMINQLESEITSAENLALKTQILDFLNMNLSVSSRKITVAHFLLGFDFSNGLSLGSKSSLSMIASKKSLFKMLLFVLESSLLTIDTTNIDYAPMRLASLSLEIVLKLCRNPLSSGIVLEFLSEYGLLKTLLDTPRIDQSTQWNKEKFNPLISSKTAFNGGPAMGAFLSLLKQRSLVLQYLSLELHRTSAEGSISKTNHYIDLLIDGYGVFAGPPKVLSFLDVLELSLDDVSTIPEDDLHVFNSVDLTLDFNKISPTINCDGPIFNLEDVDALLDLHLRSKWVDGSYKTDEQAKAKEQEIETFKSELKRADSKLSVLSNALVPVPSSIKSNESEAAEEKDAIKTKLTNFLSYNKFKTFQLASLHSWVQLIQVIVTDGKINSIKRSNFILEVFQSIIPRINDYVEQDILYAEELVSLCVSLYDIYHQDRKSTEDGESNVVDAYERLYPLFKTAIHGILSPASSITLRSDLYVLGNKYLSWILKHKDTSKEILQSIKLSSDRLITVICNDAISGEGPTRITGILLLESLFQLSNINQLNFVLDTLVKNNLLLLLVKSIKRADDTLLLSYESKISLDALLYELTAFKAILSFLIRVAETHHGAQQLLQSEIFQTIKSCQFLLIDPDLGIELVFGETSVQNSTFVKVNLSLDTPLSLATSPNGVSLFELFIPTFQLVSAILLSTSSENKPVIHQVRNLLKHFKKLIVGVLKRDMLVESKKEKDVYSQEGSKGSSLKELVNLLVLLSTLTKFDPEE
ncbi:hypothetical protein BON22_4453 [Cyberlindnera fabianii]|uniref:Nucleoporin NUP192 n=1 Tax=Cyberlindnera fabianii TaxID=36022 RepID=A0A1V2L1M0_CYBFA|nr:hypothetical protein BON22_4453 [Cyberlindnera fabianii]